jgi:hypothetical protein
MREPPVRRIDLRPSTGHKSCFAIDGGGVVTISNLGHMRKVSVDALGRGDGTRAAPTTTAAPGSMTVPFC